MNPMPHICSKTLSGSCDLVSFINLLLIFFVLFAVLIYFLAFLGGLVILVAGGHLGCSLFQTLK